MITSFAKKKKMNPMLMKVIVVSVLVHVIAGFLAGVITIATHIIKEDTMFDEPPPVQEEQPPPEVKVQIKPQKAPPEQPLQKLKMKQVNNIAIADVDVDLPGMGDSFSVSAGLGGMGGGSLLGGARGGLGMGMSDISVFGLKTRAERILFVVDANSRMVADDKGGLHSYKVIKDEISDMVGNLSAGALFNVVLISMDSQVPIHSWSPPATVYMQNWSNGLLRQLECQRHGSAKSGGSTKPKLEANPDDVIHDAVVNGKIFPQTSISS